MDRCTALPALDGLVPGALHDLHAPLGAMASLARLAGEQLGRGDADGARRVLALVAGQAERSVRLLQALRTLAQLGEAPVTLSPVHAGAIARELLHERSATDPRAAACALVLRQQPPVLADARLLRIALAQLIDNALKFTRHREHPRIELGSTEGPASVSIDVRDNGEGFEPAAAVRLFRPFVRLHGHRFEGHGLGLCIVRQAVQRQGGQVWAESTGQGACVRILLPRAGTAA